MGVVSVKAPVVYYHKVDNPDPKARLKGIYILPRRFDLQMKLLKLMGYHTINPGELLDSLEGKGTLPRKPIIITFDDGYQDNYTQALPILKKYGFGATIFVTVNHIGKYTVNAPGGNETMPAQMLTWEEMKQLEREGITIGSHTLTHRSLNRLNGEEVYRECAESKRILEEGLGHTVDFLAYPFGDFNAQVARVVKECGYRAAFTTISGRFHCSTDLFTLKRIKVKNRQHPFSFLSRLLVKPYDENNCR